MAEQYWGSNRSNIRIIFYKKRLPTVITEVLFFEKKNEFHFIANILKILLKYFLYREIAISLLRGLTYTILCMQIAKILDIERTDLIRFEKLKNNTTE